MGEYLVWIVYLAALSYRRDVWAKHCCRRKNDPKMPKLTLKSDADFWALDHELGMPNLGKVKLP